MYCNSIGDIIR